MNEEYPSNSREIRPAPEPKPEAKRILRVVGEDTKIVRRKKPLGARMREMFLGGETKGVFNYVIGEVLAPAAREMFVDAVSESMERIVYGDRKRPSRRPATKSSGFSGGSMTNYSRYSRPSETRPPNGKDLRDAPSFDEVILESRTQAQEVIDQMRDVIDEYEFVSVADFYEMVGERSHHTDHKYGWFDLKEGRVRRVNNGWLIELPRTEPRG